MKFILATLLGFMVGISGTIIGGLIALGRGRSSPEKQGWLLGFSGGIMIAVVFYDLWPEAWHYGGLSPTLIGTGAGLFLVHFADPIFKLIPWYKQHQFSRIIKTGILLGLGIAVHNFPEGVALGTTYITARGVENWPGLALLMAIHNIPEGMAMASSLKLGRVHPAKIITALILVEIPMALGGAIGAFLGNLSAEMGSISLGFAGGAMFLLALKELLPLAKKLGGFIPVGSGFVVGLFTGIFMTWIS
ncbi:MAG: ZIP family metal transporter [Firmicutes bacterium]|nr:ZIP family metal transporter [Bacillota bacterium]